MKKLETIYLKITRKAMEIALTEPNLFYGCKTNEDVLMALGPEVWGDVLYEVGYSPNYYIGEVQNMSKRFLNLFDKIVAMCDENFVETITTINNKEEKILWHISKVENFDNIWGYGIKANEDNEVFLLDDAKVKLMYLEKPHLVSQFIALNQLGLDEFVLFEVDVEGLELEPDNVAECTSEFQYIYKGDIEPERIKDYYFDNTKDLQEDYKKIV